jgi:hypothetical protein
MMIFNEHHVLWNKVVHIAILYILTKWQQLQTCRQNNERYNNDPILHDDPHPTQCSILKVMDDYEE